MKVNRTCQRKQVWTFDEDKELFELVNQFGENGFWPFIAAKMEARTGKQCRERYINHLSPRVKTDPWTPEEDDKIIKLHSMIGTKWCKFIPHLPGRSDNAIKNRWHLMQRASLQRSRDIEREKEQLLATKLLASKLAEMKERTNYISAIKPQCSDAESSSVSHDDCSLSIDSHVDIDYDFIMQLKDIHEPPIIPPAKKIRLSEASSSSYQGHTAVDTIVTDVTVSAAVDDDDDDDDERYCNCSNDGNTDSSSRLQSSDGSDSMDRSLSSSSSSFSNSHGHPHHLLLPSSPYPYEDDSLSNLCVIDYYEDDQFFCNGDHDCGTNDDTPVESIVSYPGGHARNDTYVHFTHTDLAKYGMQQMQQ